MDKPKILVTPRSLSRGGHPSLAHLAEAGYEVVFASPGEMPTEAQLLAILPECVGHLAGVEPLPRRVLESATRLRVISRNGTGTSGIDLAAAAELGIRVCRAEGANARGVAELTWAGLLALVRHVPACDAALKRQDWHRTKGVELAGRTLGLVGCGRIGQIVARFALAFDMRVLAFDPYADASFQPGEGFAWADLATVLAESDVVSLHCPPSEDGRPLLDADRIAAMKDGARVLNTARGALLDDEAVLAALDAGKIAGLAVDAFEPEPPTDWRLAGHPRVIATAHIGGFTEESVDRAATAAVENLLAALAEGQQGRRARVNCEPGRPCRPG